MATPSIPFPLTYNSLVDLLTSYAPNDNDEYISKIPAFIRFAEERISREYMGIEQNVYGTSTLTAGTVEYSKPAEHLKTESISIRSVEEGEVKIKPVWLRSLAYVTSFGFKPGTPSVYSDAVPDKFIFRPVPDKNYNIDINYVRKTPFLSASSTENWVTKNIPHVLFYACFVQALLFLDDKARVQEFEGLYQQSLMMLLNVDKKTLITKQSSVTA